MSWVEFVVYALGAVVVLVTILPLWRTPRWWVRIWDFPRSQVAVAAAVLLAALGYWRWPGSAADWTLALALVAAFAWQASWVARYLPGAPKQVPPSDKPRNYPDCIALLTGNVLLSNREADRLIPIIAAADPDVILLVETDEWWLNRLAEGLGSRYPHSVRYPLSTGYGMALFSRLELVEPEVRHVLDEAIPSIRTSVRLRSGHVIDLYGVHPQPPAPAQDSAERDTELLLVGREIAARGRPAVVLGDLNDVAWSRTTFEFQAAGGLLDPRRGRGFFSTYHAKLPGLRWPLDYVFHTCHFCIGSLRILPRFGSDHLPLLAVLCYDPATSGTEKASPPDHA